MAQASIIAPYQKIPKAVYQQAIAHQLDECKAIYTPRYSNPLLIIGMVLGMIVLDIVVWAVLASIFDRISYYLLFVPFIIIGYGIYGLIHSNERVYAFGNGFIYAKGRRLVPVRWDQVGSVWRKISQGRSGTSFVYTVCRNDGQMLKFGSPLRNVNVLGNELQEQVNRLQLPRAIAAYYAGQPVTFGVVRVDGQGINNGKELIPWDQIGCIRLPQEVIAVEKNGRLLKWPSVKGADVPNLVVFIRLVEHIVKGQQ